MTKDEFLDIMGGIDESIIDGTLDISRMDTVVIPYKRPSVLKYIIYAAACIALVFAVGSAVRYLNGRVLPPNDGTSESTSVINIDNISYSETSDTPAPDIIRGWDPEDIQKTDPVVGGSAVLSAAELDGMSVSLILHDITKLPGEKYSANGHDYTDYWGAKDIVLCVKDDMGRKTIENFSPCFDNDYDPTEYFLPDECIFDGCTRLFKTEKNGKYTYIVMQFADRDTDSGALIARYYTVAIGTNYEALHDENDILSNSLIPLSVTGINRIGGWAYGYQTSKSIYQKENSVLSDPEYGYEMIIDPDHCGKIVYPYKMPEGYENAAGLTGWDPEELEYDPDPEAGETAVVSAASADGMTVSLIMYNVIKRPGEEHRAFSDDWWAAEQIYLYVKDGEGRRLLAVMPSPLHTFTSGALPEACLFDGCTRLIKTETDGETHYLLIQHVLCGDEGEPLAYFFDLDMELYTADTDKDENGICLGSLQPLGVSHNEATGSTAGCRVSESFAHKEGTTFVDPVYGYEVKFDYDSFSGTAVSTQGVTTGFDVDAFKYDFDPSIGESGFLSICPSGEIMASLVAYNITHLPGDEVDGISHTEDCKDYLCAERIALYIQDNRDRRVLSAQFIGDSEHNRIHGKCLFEFCTRLYNMEQDGKRCYLLMQYTGYDESSESFEAEFFIIDMEAYDNDLPKDEYGISCGSLIPVSFPDKPRMGQSHFEHMGGTTLFDPEYGYKITFDINNATAAVVYPNE